MNNKEILYHTILSVNDTGYHLFKMNNPTRIKQRIIEVLKSNDILYYIVGENKIYTTDSGYFYIQMELINDIEIK